jgi:Tfp pilus assembly protein PilO
MSTRRIWAIGCAVIMAVSIALGWLLGVSPLLSTASLSDESRRAAEAQNDVYSQELAILKEKFSGIDELQEQLDELRVAMPPTARQPDFIDELSRASLQHRITLTTITTADAVAYASNVVAPPVAETPDADDATTDSADEAESAPAAESTPLTLPGEGVPVTSGLVTGENFIAIPVSLTFTGDYTNSKAFINSLQTGDRLTSVTGFALTQGGETGANGGAEPPTSTDTVSGTMSLLIWVLIDPTAEEAEE